MGRVWQSCLLFNVLDLFLLTHKNVIVVKVFPSSLFSWLLVDFYSQQTLPALSFSQIFNCPFKEGYSSVDLENGCLHSFIRGVQLLEVKNVVEF